MRYFFVSWRAGTNEQERFGDFAVRHETMLSHKSIIDFIREDFYKREKNPFIRITNDICITNIIEFKSEQDYNDFIGGA